jgi:peptidyl-tRNA hydrolase
MTPGKMCSQAGHGYLGSFLQAQLLTPSVAAAYAADLPGTKICFSANLAELERAHFQLQQQGIPSFLVIDSGCPNFFDGKPIITALGFGPATKAQVKSITKRLKLL